MTDIVSKEQRRLNMQHIRGKDTEPELYLRKLLFKNGYRYRLYSKQIPGHPDLWLARYNTAVFVHGCFWHRHKDCKYAYTPKSRIEFWNGKFEKNVARDEEVQAELKEQHIRCLIIWECTIKAMKKSVNKEREVLCKIQTFLGSDESSAAF